MQHSVTSRYSYVLHRSSPTRVAAASAPARTGSHLKALEALEVLEEGLDQTMFSDLGELLIKYLEGNGEKYLIK